MRSREALIIVDVQRDFCPGGALPVPDGDKVVESLNDFIEVIKNPSILSCGPRDKDDWVLVATRDWHPEKTTHFDKWPAHCIQNTKGAQFHPDLDLSAAEIFSKGMGIKEDAYSGFDARNEEGLGLAEFLRKKRVRTVYIGGLATDYCVKATALDAVGDGLGTYLLVDAIRSVNINPGDGEKAVIEMALSGIKFVNTRYLLGNWMR